MSDEIDNLLREAREARRDKRLIDARRDLLRAVALLRQEGGPIEVAGALRDLAELERSLDVDAGRQHYEEAVAILREVDRPLLLAHTIRHLGDVHYGMGHKTPAEQCYQEALALYRADGERRPLDLANAIRSLAVLRSDSGECDEATRLWQEAHDLYESLDVPAGVAESARRLAALTHSGRDSRDSRSQRSKVGAEPDLPDRKAR